MIRKPTHPGKVFAEDEVDRIFDAKYEHRELEKTDGSYIITVYGDAPFPDNLEGY